MLILKSPLKIEIGDKIVAITLSWGGPEACPYRYDIGKQRLRDDFKLHIISMKNTFRCDQYIEHNPQQIASDLMEAFLNKKVKAIFSTIGGNRAINLIPYIDLDVIKNNPKIFLGYSDMTVIHFMCIKAGIRSFYGPSIMDSFAENVQMFKYTIEGIHKTLFSTTILGNIPKNRECWTTEFLNWNDYSNQKIKRFLHRACEWRFIGNISKRVRGRLIGGCVEVLNSLAETSLWPDLSIWDQSILFLEISNEIRGINVLKKFMDIIFDKGILSNISGILFSKPGGEFMVPEKLALYDDLFIDKFNEYNIPLIPIVTRMDFGHSEPMWTIPYGVLAEIIPNAGLVSILESGVS